MKSKILGAVIIAVLLSVCGADAQLDPASVAMTNTRGDTSQAFVPGGIYFDGTTLLFTNCLACVAASTNIQDLTDITIDITVGNAATNDDYVGTAMVATSGTWWVSFTVPTQSTMASPQIQTKLTHTNGTIYIYPLKVLRTSDPL